jgi:hypothetical protein
MDFLERAFGCSGVSWFLIGGGLCSMLSSRSVTAS